MQGENRKGREGRAVDLRSPEKGKKSWTRHTECKIEWNKFDISTLLPSTRGGRRDNEKHI